MVPAEKQKVEYNMNTPENSDDTDDLVVAIREGRSLRLGKPFRVLIGDEELNFQPAIFTDPQPLGRQFIEKAGGSPVQEHAAVAILSNGDFEDIGLDEKYDLRGRGAEKVLVFRTDRSFKFKIDDRDLEWPRACISGFVLKKIAELKPNYSLWREVRGGHDIKVADTDLVRLDDAGVERFISLIDQTTEGLELLPTADKEYLEGSGYDFEVVEEGGKKGVIFNDFPLPPKKFEIDATAVLVLMPGGYPDCAPDMFFASPRLVLKNTGREPRATNGSLTFGGQTYQQWSRHQNSWRAGLDGMRTMIARINTALEGAA